MKEHIILFKSLLRMYYIHIDIDKNKIYSIPYGYNIYILANKFVKTQIKYNFRKNLVRSIKIRFTSFYGFVTIHVYV